MVKAAEIKLKQAFKYFGPKLQVDMTADCGSWMRLGIEQVHLEDEGLVLVDSFGKKHNWSLVSAIYELRIIGEFKGHTERGGVVLAFPKTKRHLRLIK